MKTLLHDMDVRDEGIAEGNTKAIIELVKKKMTAGKNIEQIAAEVEKSTETVKKLYDTILECGLESDIDTIYEMLNR